ncbi:hypothetical protein [Bacteroides finegoldii]|uniref:hypothetical protein n=1 Tax=Bacteroides finegoldii TaxID=338188 RepID=UPI0032F0932E
MSVNRKRLCVYYLTYLESGGNRDFCSLIVSFLFAWGSGGHFRTRKVICGQEETTCHSVLYICTSEEKRSIDKNKYIGYGNSDD